MKNALVGLSFGLVLLFQAPSALFGQVRYNLSVRLEPHAHRLDVSGTMRLPAEPAARAVLQLSLSELMHDLRVEVVEPATSAGLAQLERPAAGDQYPKWTVRPLRPIAANRSVLLSFSYAGGGGVANQFYIGDEVSFASAWGTDWYPGANGKKGVGMLRFSVSAGQTVKATGHLTSQPTEASAGRFTFEVTHPTYFAFAAGNYSVRRRAGKVPLAAYLLTPREHIDQYLDEVSKIADTLAGEFGPYPFEELALVEIPRDLAQKAGFNGAATQGFVFTNSRAFDAPVKYVLNFFGHEFSHEWFPHTLALKTPPGLYMEEALAEYGGLRVVECLAGVGSAEQYRRTGYEFDPGYSAFQYFKLAALGADQPLWNLEPRLENRLLAYSKGFLVFDMLAREIGRERFRRILSDITRRDSFKPIAWNTFLKAIERGAGRDLGWFYDEWFRRTGAPDFDLMWKNDGKMVRGHITQPPPYYTAVLEIEATGDHGQSVTRRVRAKGPDTSFSFPVGFPVTSVALDPHYLVLRWTPEFHKAAAESGPAKRQ